MDLPVSQEFWLTRDCSEGELSNDVEIWLYKPHPLRYADGDITWIAPLGVVDRKATYVGSLSVVLARLELGNGVPATSWECLHVDRSPGGKV